MKPNFALNMSHEGLRLLHRFEDGWVLVGETRLDAPDLGKALGHLREQAEALADGQVTTKLVLPNTQVLYTTLHAPGPDSAERSRQIADALVGLTPYDVSDLVFDFRADGETVQVAVVARETLGEAEGFAADFKFNPVSFVAAPAPGDFEGEPFFGTTTCAARILGKEFVEPDKVPIKGTRPPAPAVVAAPVEEEPAAALDVDVQAAPEVSAPVEIAEEAAKPEPAVEETPAPKSPVFTRAQSPEKTEPAKPEPVAKAPETPPLAETAPVESKAVAPKPAPTFASRRSAEPVDAKKEPAAPRIAATPVSPPPEKPVGITEFSALDLDDVPDMPAWRSVGRATPDEAPSVKPVAKPPTITAVTPPSARPPLPRRQPVEPRADASAGALHLGPFATRDAPPVGGKPRHLGLALTAALLVAFAVAALWSVLGSRDDPTTPQEIAALPSEPVVATPPVETAPEPAPEQPVAALPAPVPEPEQPAAALPSSEPDAEAVTAAVQEALQPPAPTQDPEPTEEPVVAAAPPPDRVTEAPPSRSEAERRYAITGVWQLDPAPLRTPSEAPADALSAGASSDAEISPTELSALPGAGPDNRPSSLAPPPRLRASFNLDERGLVAATAGGNLSPDGTLVFLGTPPVAVGARPGSISPEGLQSETPVIAAALPRDTAEPEPPVVALPEAAATPSAEPEPDPETEVARAATTPVLPTLRPGTVVPDPEAAAPDEGTEQLALLPNPNEDILRELRPAPRPSALDDGTAAAPEPELTEPELEEDVENPFALIRPVLRPRSAQEERESEQQRLPDEAEAAGEEEATEPEEPSALATTASVAPWVRPRSLERQAVRLQEETRKEAQNPTPVPDPGTQRVAAAVVPSIPSRASVARAATEQNALRLNRVNLIGVYGSPSDRRALVRLRSGRYVKVEVGDRIDGGQVRAISADELRYVKGGQNITLKMPRG